MLYDRNGSRGQEMYHQEGGYSGTDGFMDRFSRMGGYGQEEAPPVAAGSYGQSGMGQAMAHMQQAMQQLNPMQQQAMQQPRQQQAMQQQPMQAPQMSAPQMPVIDTTALRETVEQLGGQLASMQALYEKNAACVNEIREIIDSEDKRISMLLEQANQAAEAAAAAKAEEVLATARPAEPVVVDNSAKIEESLDQSFRRIKEMMDERASEDERRMEERTQAELTRRQADAMRQDEIRQTIEDLQSELTGFRDQMNSISSSVSENMTGMDERLTNSLGETLSVSLEGILAGTLGEKLDERAQVTDKNTHDVGVRIYRNVQASMNDYLSKQTSALDTAITGLNQRMESLEDSFLHRKGATTPLTIATLVTGLVNLGVLIIYILSNY